LPVTAAPGAALAAGRWGRGAGRAGAQGRGGEAVGGGPSTEGDWGSREAAAPPVAASVLPRLPGSVLPADARARDERPSEHQLPREEGASVMGFCLRGLLLLVSTGLTGHIATSNKLHMLYHYTYSYISLKKIHTTI